MLRYLFGFLFLSLFCSAAHNPGEQSQKSALTPEPARSITLRVVATGAGGKPVTDLTDDDFSVSDDGAKKITSLHLNQDHGPAALTMLFDLLNLNMGARGVLWQQIKQAAPEMPASDAFYLYLLVKDGSLYPVHGLPALLAGSQANNPSWLHNIGPLMDKAMDKVNQLRPTDLAVDIYLRFQATYRALDQMRALMSAVRGHKELIWSTYGVPSSILMADHEWFDCTPLLRELASRFNDSDISVYTVDPGMNLERGQLNRDSLDILTRLTGGRTFGTSDLRAAAVQAVADARTNYSLTYTPPAKNWNGKFHKIKLTCKRKGVRIQAQEGYIAAPE